MSFQYKIYGLRLNSSRSINLLDEQQNQSEETDLFVHWSSEKSAMPHDSFKWERVLTNDLKRKKKISLWTSQTTNGVFTKLRFATDLSHIDFLLDGAKKNLWITHDRDEAESDLDSYFVGPALGCVLRLRGTICLHASAVNVGEKAVVFLAKKRGGKSTTAAGFHRLGYRVVSDDIAVITPRGDDYFIQSGYSKIRLRANPAAAFFQAESERMPAVYKHRDSRYLSLEKGNDFSSDALPLAAIYLLGEINAGDTTPFVEPIAPSEKIVRLTENTFGSYVVNQGLRRKEFAFLAALAKKIPFRRLMFGHDLRTLDAQCRTILEDLPNLTQLKCE
jgi:hypothetical protein